MAFNSLLRASLTLKLPLSCRALKQLEMTKLSLFLIDYNFSLLIRVASWCGFHKFG